MIPNDLSETARILLRLGAAFLLALPIGWERELRERSPGLRTFALVSLGSCAYLLLGQHVFGPSLEAQARVLQGLLTGIGFVGAGAILKGERDVHGIATAASIWNTAAVGAAAAYGSFVLGVALSVANLATLHFLRTGHGPSGPRDRQQG
jgi:putative Mg2+ transporter-C (MgtC) family protein